VFTYDSDAGVLDQLGTGTVTGGAVEKTNSALLDEYEQRALGRKNFTVEASLAAETSDAWFTKLGGSGTLTITTEAGGITGTFGVRDTKMNLNDEMTWDVTLISLGDVTES
jgi:hypothetical protein